MRPLAYFTLPTVVGWLAGSATCVAAMSLLNQTVLRPSDMLLAATVAGLFIVAPTYIFFSLPYSFLSRRYFREHKRCLPWWPLCVLLLLFGAAATFVPLFHMYGEHITLRSETPVENPALFLVPFVPYSLVVAWLISRLTKWSLPQNA